MKTITALIAFTMTLMATMAYADGLPKRLIRSNAPCAGVSSPGFLLGGQYFIAETAAAYCPADAARMTVVPSSVDVKDLAEVIAYLASIGETNIEPVINSGRVIATKFDDDGNEVSPERYYDPAYARRW